MSICPVADPQAVRSSASETSSRQSRGRVAQALQVDGEESRLTRRPAKVGAAHHPPPEFGRVAGDRFHANRVPSWAFAVQSDLPWSPRQNVLQFADLRINSRLARVLADDGA